MSDARQRRAGALALALVGGAVVLVLAFSDESVGPGVRFEVEWKTTGPLHSGAKIKIAGRDVGEVRGMYRLAERAREPDHDVHDIRDAGGVPERARADAQHVVADCFVVAAWAEHVRRNSDLFIATPSILGEAWLEVGPPLRHAEPAAAVAENDRVRGSDPPDLDELLPRVYTNLSTAWSLLKAHRGDWDAAMAGIRQLRSDLIALRSDLDRADGLRDRLSSTAREGRALARVLEETRLVDRAESLSAELGPLAERLEAEGPGLAARAATLRARADALATILPPEQRDRATRAVDELRATAARAELLAAAVRAIGTDVTDGRGTLGGFYTDREIYEDFHEVHRLLKWKSWRLFKKSQDVLKNVPVPHKPAP